jgi:hypothetical protein
MQTLRFHGNKVGERLFRECRHIADIKDIHRRAKHFTLGPEAWKGLAEMRVRHLMLFKHHVLCCGWQKAWHGSEPGPGLGTRNARTFASQAPTCSQDQRRHRHTPASHQTFHLQNWGLML